MTPAVGQLGEVDSACPSCRASGMRAFFEQEGVPSHSVLLLDSADEARAFPRGTIRLAFCPACGFIANVAVDESLQAYSSQCEETQAFSPRFQQFATELARDLVDRHDLRGRTVLEIGCGKGEFLSMLCELGANRGVGIDPAAIPDRVPQPAAGSVEVIPEYYGERHSDLGADVLVCRHTLEHIPRTGDFLELIAGAAAGREAGLVVFELPDTVRVLREGAFWDIYYEHCSYFSPGSLARLFRRHGLTPQRSWLEYEDQYLMLESSGSGGPPGEPLAIEESPEQLWGLVTAFVEQVEQAVGRWRDKLAAARESGTRVAVWGSGSKAVSFLGTVARDADHPVHELVDVNPHRHGRFLPGSGMEVLPPERLRDSMPGLVIAMNPVYLDEIGGKLEAMELRPELVAV